MSQAPVTPQSPWMRHRFIIICLAIMLALCLLCAFAPPQAGLSAWQALTLGVIEGLTEFLPISSTGHLLLVNRLWGAGPDDQALADTLAVIIQIGAIMAVVLVWKTTLLRQGRGLLRGERAACLWHAHLLAAFIPCAIIGLSFHEQIKAALFCPEVIAGAFLAGGLLLLWRNATRERGDKDLNAMNYKHALIIGCAQCLAFCPGTSRSLTVLVACLALGYSLAAAVEFAFMLGLVTLGSAAAKELLDHASQIQSQFGLLVPAIAMIAATVMAALSARYLLTFLRSGGFRFFGFYRIALAGVIVTVLILR